MLVFDAIEGSFELGVFHFQAEMKADFLSFLGRHIVIKVDGDFLRGILFGKGLATVLANEKEKEKNGDKEKKESCLVHIYDEPKKKY